VAIEISIVFNFVLAIALTLKWMAYTSMAEKVSRQRARAERFATLASHLRKELNDIKNPPAIVPRGTPKAPLAGKQPWPGLGSPFVKSGIASNPVTAPISEPSFERMEAEAIQDQEKYYEPAPRV
jgi:hypothetical protein